MRSFRNFRATITALTLSVFAAAPLAAQGSADWDVRPDSWYWGIYGGQSSFATTIARTTAPMVGVDWMITRKRFALNVFAEQSYFNAVSTVPDSPSSAPRRVDFQDLRRVGGSAMMFLPPYKYFHPWVGAGYAFNFVRSATPQGSSYASPGDRDIVVARVDEARTHGGVFGDVGMMVTYKQWAPFIQYTVMPTKGSSSWLLNGEGFTNVWKLGWRYSFGSAIDNRF